MRQDQMRRFVVKHPFTVFVLGGNRATIPIGMFYVFHNGILFSSSD